MPKVWFIRHGESEANAGLPTLFPMKTELTSNGIKQAEYIAQSFPRPPSLIITSKYIRAWQTAQPTVKRYLQARLVHPDDWPVHEFTYLSPSKVARTTVQDRKHLVDTYWTRNHPYYVDGEGAESFITFIRRVSHVLARLRHSNEEFIAVFTHGQFIHAVQWLVEICPASIDGKSMKQFRNFLNCTWVPTGAILPAKLDRKEIKLGTIITCHLTPVVGERFFDERPHFVEEVWPSICCEGCKLVSIAI